MRSIAARRDGYRCCYCRVPTAATIEHVDARSKGGSNWADNLMLACPYCNRKKGDRPLERFLAEEGWKLVRPELPGTVKEMLKQCFAWERGTGVVSSGSTNAKLELSNEEAILLVRAHKTDAWQRLRLGRADTPAVTQAAWDFLTRHDTPTRPRRRRPPKRAYARR